MGVILAILGTVFSYVLWTSYQRAEETRDWVATPAKILSSQVVPDKATPNSPTKHRVVVRYQYTFGGSVYHTDRIRRSDGPKNSQEEAEALRQEYTPGQQLTCWVNPLEPGYAVLKQESRAALYTIWFPLLFVGGGLRMAWGALRRRKKKK